MHHAAFSERVAYLEQTLGDSDDEHWHEIQAPKAAHAKHDIAHGRKQCGEGGLHVDHPFGPAGLFGDVDMQPSEPHQPDEKSPSVYCWITLFKSPVPFLVLR